MDTPCFHEQATPSAHSIVYTCISCSCHFKFSDSYYHCCPLGVLVTTAISLHPSLQPDWPLGKKYCIPASFILLASGQTPASRVQPEFNLNSTRAPIATECMLALESPMQQSRKWGPLHWDYLVCIPAFSQTGLCVKNNTSQPPSFCWPLGRTRALSQTDLSIKAPCNFQ